ncbi:MAG: RNA 2',3'-cyclic phosphodiesterase [Candidatus Peregrinibacteria bacterium]
MRLFISIPLPPSLQSYCKKLQRQFPHLKVTEDFHLTLQFLGDGIPEDRVPAIIDKLSNISFRPFPITLGDAVPFGNPKEPHGVWIECKVTPPLQTLADHVRAAMGNVGYLPDKPFRAHVTLGRYKKGPPHVPKPVPGEPHEFTVGEFTLVQSHLSPSGPRHQILKAFTAG